MLASGWRKYVNHATHHCIWKFTASKRHVQQLPAISQWKFWENSSARCSEQNQTARHAKKAVQRSLVISGRTTHSQLLHTRPERVTKTQVKSWLTVKHKTQSTANWNKPKPSINSASQDIYFTDLQPRKTLPDRFPETYSVQNQTTIRLLTDQITSMSNSRLRCTITHVLVPV